MNAVTLNDARGLQRVVRMWPSRPATVVLGLGLVALYGPVLVGLAHGPWREEDGAFAPILCLAAAALAWIVTTRAGPLRRPGTGAAMPWLVAGAILGALGLALGNLFLAFVSLVPVLASLLALSGGWALARRHGYSLAALIFAAPLPGAALVALTFPLKLAVSDSAERALRTIGLPVERHGVLLDIGDYRLLVADACSGLQSMFTLAAAALLYLGLVRHRSPLRVGLLIAAILPSAFMANVTRVVLLALITRAWGDDAGQSYLHGAAGVMMFAVAFLVLMGLDGVFDRLFDDRRPARA